MQNVGGNGYPLQYSCLENSLDRGAWWATVHGIAESDMTEQLTLFLVCIVSLITLPKVKLMHTSQVEYLYLHQLLQILG